MFFNLFPMLWMGWGCGWGYLDCTPYSLSELFFSIRAVIQKFTVISDFEKRKNSVGTILAYDVIVLTRSVFAEL